MFNFLKNIGKSEHERIAEMLSAYIDGELSPAQKARVETHLAECEECAEDLRTLRQTVNLLGQLPTVKAPRSFVIREAQVAPRRRVGLKWRWAYPALQGATVVAFLLFVVVSAGDAVLTRFAPSMSGAPLVEYRAPTIEDREAEWVAQEKAVEETVVSEVEEVAAMAATATPSAVGTPAPPAPAGTPMLAASGEPEPTPTRVAYEETQDNVPPTEEAMMTRAEKTTEETPSPTVQATPLPTATPVEVAEVLQEDRGNGALPEEASAAGRRPLVGPTRFALWVIEGGLLILAVALLIVTLWMRRARKRRWG
jgi:anti-sigma factor RsiW